MHAVISSLRRQIRPGYRQMAYRRQGAYCARNVKAAAHGRARLTPRHPCRIFQCTVHTMQKVVGAGKSSDAKRLDRLRNHATGIKTAKCDLTKTRAYRQIVDGAFLGEAVHLNKNVYVDALKDARRTGEFSAWTRVFCSMVAQSAASNLERLEKLGVVHARWLAATKSVRTHSVVHRLVPWTVTKPTFTVRDALTQSADPVTFQAMNTAIKRLIDLGMSSSWTAVGAIASSPLPRLSACLSRSTCPE